MNFFRILFQVGFLALMYAAGIADGRQEYPTLLLIGFLVIICALFVVLLAMIHNIGVDQLERFRNQKKGLLNSKTCKRVMTPLKLWLVTGYLFIAISIVCLFLENIRYILVCFVGLATVFLMILTCLVNGQGFVERKGEIKCLNDYEEE